MKVLHVIWDVNQGGAQTYLTNLVRFSKGKDIVIDVAVLTQPGIYSDCISEQVNKIYYYDFKHGFDIFMATQLYLSIKKIDPDVIHDHTNTIIAIISMLLTRIPLVHTEHGAGVMNNYPRSKIIEYILYKILGKFIKYFIAVSVLMKNKMVNVNKKITNNVIVIPNGVDYELINTVVLNKDVPSELLNNQFYKIGIVGRLTHVKGIDLFLSAAKKILERKPNVFFFVIGDGELRTELYQLANNLGLNNNVFFLGYRPDAIALMRYFDLYLMTSHFESFGLTIVEAMGVGVPVVAANMEGPLTEIIDHTIDGLLVGNREPDDLAHAVIGLLEDEPLRRKMGAHARRKVQTSFSMQSNANAVLDCYMLTRRPFLQKEL